MMRKYKRAVLRGRAEKLGVKPSKYVHNKWIKYQMQFRSAKEVAINKARGTKKKENWSERISFALAKLAKGVA